MQAHIPSFLRFLPTSLLESLRLHAEPVPAIPDLAITKGLRSRFGRLESDEALRFIVSIYEKTYPLLREILEQRQKDRAFLDNETLACVKRNEGVDYCSPAYETAIGKHDEAGRLVLGMRQEQQQWTPVTIPPSMQGEQVTLFGPPDDPRMAINAMNALHRRLPDEAPIVTKLVEEAAQVPRWGADNEDSMTPLAENLLAANTHLLGCYDGSLTFQDPVTQRHYAIQQEGRAKPIKRIPGLAIPDGHHLYHGQPLPLHLTDFALQLYHNWQHPEALVFYIPKLEDEDEARYLKTMILCAEEHLHALYPAYKIGSIRLFVVFEHPRAIFRINEIAEALSPYFLGGSLGWHDFLASAARLFRNDPNYRIPVKADPNIVINRIKASHELLVRALDPIGGIKIGGMYGVLYEDGNPRSFEVCMVGYIKDVTTQLKRGLDGFWVAHPNFVRIGLALVQAWRRKQRDPQDTTLRELICALVPSESEQIPLLRFVEGADVQGLSPEDPLYQRGVLAADLAVSDVIANDHPDEVRYNIFQALQYLADWLRGNGCVALPAAMKDAKGELVFVRIMDDLATTERSRWELWAEVAHGRVPLALFEQLLAEEIAFIREGRETATKRVQIRWEGACVRWYPIAVKLLRQLVTDPEPVEFVSELLLPFTFDVIRQADDPWEAACSLCPDHYRN
jgi:malate synthase